MKRLRWFDYLTINLFWLGLNIRNTAVGSVFTPFLVDVFVHQDIKNTALGILSTSGLILAMVAQPAFGLLSDRSTSHFGRRRPFIFTGVLFDLLFLALIGLSGSYTVLFIVLLFQQISANVSHGPLQGLIPDLVPEDQRGRASAVKAIFELLPIVIVPFLIAPLVASGQMGWAIGVTCVGLFLAMLITVLTVREEPLRIKPQVSLREPMLRVFGVLAGIVAGGGAGLLAGGLVGGLLILIVRPLAGLGSAQVAGISVGGLTAMVVAVVVGVWSGTASTLGKDAHQNTPFTWWVVNRLLFLAAVTSIQRFTMYFLMSAFQLDRGPATQLTANLTMAVGIFTVASALPGGWLGDRFGIRRMVSLSGLIATLGTLVLLITTLTPNLPLMYAAGSLIGIGAGLFMTTNWALGTELAPPQEAGRYLGISNLAGAGAGMIGAGLGGPVADLVNRYHPGFGYFVIFACYAVLFLLSSISLLRIRPAIRPAPAMI